MNFIVKKADRTKRVRLGVSIPFHIDKKLKSIANENQISINELINQMIENCINCYVPPVPIGTNVGNSNIDMPIAGKVKPSCKIVCFKCHKIPEEIPEYQEGNFWKKDDAISGIYDSPTDYVMKEEGTFNPKTNTFVCSDCYIKIGMPAGKGRKRWIAPEEVLRNRNE